MRQKNNIIFLILVFVLSGCGFTSGQFIDILKAQDYIKEQKFTEAIQLYESILENKPSKTIQLKINYQLGQLNSIYLNNHAQAIRNFEQAIKITDEPIWQVKSLEKIAQIHFENLKHYKGSLVPYRKLMNFIPRLENHDFYKFRCAQSLFHLEKYRSAIQLFKQLTVESNTEYNIRSFYFLGLTHFYNKAWDKAISYWFEYLKREKRNDKIVQVKFMIANAYESAEQLKEAYNIYYSNF